MAEGQSQEEADGGWGEEYLGHLAWVMNARVMLENQGSSGLSLSVGWPASDTIGPRANEGNEGYGLDESER